MWRVLARRKQSRLASRSTPLMNLASISDIWPRKALSLLRLEIWRSMATEILCHEERIIAFLVSCLFLLEISRLAIILPLFLLFAEVSGCAMNMSKSMWLRACFRVTVKKDWWVGSESLTKCAEDCARLLIVDQAKYLGYWLGACATNEVKFAAAFPKTTR